jgi:hypothetical protein
MLFFCKISYRPKNRSSLLTPSPIIKVGVVNVPRFTASRSINNGAARHADSLARINKIISQKRINVYLIFPFDPVILFHKRIDHHFFDII